MRKAPPFYYYDQFSPESKKYILDELTKAELHDTALEEYRLAHEEKEIDYNFEHNVLGRDLQR